MGQLFLSIAQALQGHSGSCFLLAEILMPFAEASLEVAVLIDSTASMLPAAPGAHFSLTSLPIASVLSSGCCPGWAPFRDRHPRLSICPRCHTSS